MKKIIYIRLLHTFRIQKFSLTVALTVLWCAFYLYGIFALIKEWCAWTYLY